ncbi:hypothetical protein PFISCL1PPCAC_7323, partial [Pristionchus fissidentatus]
KYPDVVIQEIAKRLDYSAINTMKLVHSRFNCALSDPLIWIQLCERDNRTLPSYEFRKGLAEHLQKDEHCLAQIDFEKIWARDPFRSNLVHADSIIMKEEVVEETSRLDDPSRDPFNKSPEQPYLISSISEVLRFEEPPIGCVTHPEVKNCKSTRKWMHIDRQLGIDLLKEGVPEWILDHVRPRIIISQFIALHRHRDPIVEMRARLIVEGELPTDEVPLVRRNRRVAWMADPLDLNGPIPLTQWRQVENVFEDYPMGVRQIGINATYSGAGFTNVQVRVELPEEFRWLTRNEFPDAYTDCCGIRLLRVKNRFISADGWFTERKSFTRVLQNWWRSAKLRMLFRFSNARYFKNARRTAFQWIVEDHNGLVAVRTLREPALYLSHKDGEVSHVDKCTTNELWMLIHSDRVQWTIRTKDYRYLSYYDREFKLSTGKLRYFDCVSIERC